MRGIRGWISRHRSVLCGLTVVALLAFFAVATGTDQQISGPDQRSVIVAAHAAHGGVAMAPLTAATPPETGVPPLLCAYPVEAAASAGFVYAHLPNQLRARAPPPHGCS